MLLICFLVDDWSTLESMMDTRGKKGLLPRPVLCSITCLVWMDDYTGRLYTLVSYEDRQKVIRPIAGTASWNMPSSGNHRDNSYIGFPDS
jgi:hypothetical protein